jgi:predicted branched-subunit amino acid permease
MFGNPSFRKGARDAVVILIPVAVFGAAYGVFAVDVGFSPLLAVFSSMIIVSGAAQFTMVGLLTAGAVPVLVAVTGLGLRHLPMSAKLADLIGPQPLATRLRLAWVLVDETFGLTFRASYSGVEDIVVYKSAADLMLYSTWIVSTSIGAWFGGSVDPEAIGIAVLFPLLFLGLAFPMFHVRRDWIVAGASVAATLIATVTLPAAWQITAAASAAALVGVFIHE